MHLDPKLRDFLADLAAAEAPHPVDMGLEAAREGFSALWRAVNPEPRALARTDTLTIPGPRGDIALEIYVPRDSDAPLPVLAWFHGGGGCMMSPDAYVGTSTALAAEADCIVVAPRYRLAPEYPFPAPLEDCYATFRWLQENAGDIGGDTARIAIAGDSGGGYLAAAVAQEAKRLGTPQPLLQVLIYPMTDMAGLPPSRVETDTFLDDRTMQWVIGMHFGEHRLDPRASPVLAEDVGGLAPALVIAAEIDPLRDEGRAYALKLRKAGVSVHYQLYEGVVHGFFNFGFLDASKLAMDQVSGALKRAFAG
ncbi:MAG: alpha/beta hydrolase [Alphaproteobacteria bacterium]